MKFDLSDDRYGFETTDNDIELAKHVKSTAESVRDLATYVVGEARKQCHSCGEVKPCRPLALQDENGRPTMGPICAPCQQEFVEERMRMAKEQAAPDDEGPADA